MYSIDQFTPVYFSHVNLRSESHGKEQVSCCDIAIAQTVSNDVLKELAAPLKRLFFKPAGSLDDDPELDGIPPHSDMPEVRRTGLALPVTLDTVLFGYRLEIDFGIGGDSNIVVESCKVNEFIVKELMDKGVVRLKYRIQASGLSPTTLGLLGAQLKRKPLIKLTGPSIEVQQELQAAAEKDKPKPGRPPKAKSQSPAHTEAGEQPNAGEIFAAHHADAKPAATGKVHTLKAAMASASKKARGHAARP